RGGEQVHAVVRAAQRERREVEASLAAVGAADDTELAVTQEGSRLVAAEVALLAVPADDRGWHGRRGPVGPGAAARLLGEPFGAGPAARRATSKHRRPGAHGHGGLRRRVRLERPVAIEVIGRDVGHESDVGAEPHLLEMLELEGAELEDDGVVASDRAPLLEQR